MCVRVAVPDGRTTATQNAVRRDGAAYTRGLTTGDTQQVL